MSVNASHVDYFKVFFHNLGVCSSHHSSENFYFSTLTGGTYGRGYIGRKKVTISKIVNGSLVLSVTCKPDQKSKELLSDCQTCVSFFRFCMATVVERCTVVIRLSSIECS